MTRTLTPMSFTARHVPPGVARQVRFGGALGWGGWLGFGFAMIFVWVFGAQADLSAWTQFGGDVVEAKGKVTAVRATSASVGGGKGRKGTPVIEYDYSFLTADERRFTGQSYTTGRRFEPDAPVVVEHLPGRPDISRIKGTRRKVWPPGMIFLTLLAVPPVVIIVVALRKGGQNVRLLREGVITQGKLVKREPTNTRVNNKTVYKFTFGFQDNRGRTHQVVTRTHEIDDIGDESTETVVYDPDDPSKACVVDALPGRVKFDDRGEIRPHGLGLAGWALAGLVLGVHTVVAIVMFGK